MTSALGTILPYALGAAISPLLLTVEIIILAGDVKPRQRAWLYTAGAAVVAAVLIAAFALVFRSLDVTQGAPTAVERGIEITGALVLGAFAVRAFLPVHPTHDDKPGKLHEWMQSGKGRTFFLIGMLMMATNLSSIVIIIPGVHAVESQRPGVLPAVIAFLVTLAFLMLPALLPIGLITILGHRADGFLKALNAFVTKHARTITGVICTAIAVYLLIGAFS